MAGEENDPRVISIKPRVRYNTIGGVNGPLVILENVREEYGPAIGDQILKGGTGQIPAVQRDRVFDAARWH